MTADSEFLTKLIKERYCIANENSWSDICNRVSSYLAKNTDEKNEFYSMMMNKMFIPNSPTLMNAGTETPMLSACFYLPISDCISNGRDGIFDQVKNSALIFKYGGGVGLNFSKLRPAGSKVKSTNGVSSGVISFMKNFNTMTETIKQGGKRRGALMGCLDINHPEIKEFLVCKQNEGELSNFNISVKLNDWFMNEVCGNKEKALEIFNLIINGIYKNGEPGILFKDEIERHNPNPENGELNPNPCAEALLSDFESCNLGSINLSSLYIQNDESDWAKHINWVRYTYLIKNGVIFLNRVIDKNKYPLPEIDLASKKTRKIGLGVMGLHDLLLKLNVPYDSETALHISKNLEVYLKTIADAESKQHNFNNASLTTIAPTGTISIIANVSSGIEPVFNWVITRKDSLGEHYIVHPIFDEALKQLIFNFRDYDSKFTDEQEAYDYIIQHCHEKGTIQDIPWLPKQFKLLFKNAMDIGWEQHIKMQATYQTNGVDMSISKTINLPNNATKDDIKSAIIMAWKMKCKGLTIYRSGSRENEVLNLKKPDADDIDWIDVDTEDHFYEKKIPAWIYKVKSGCGKFYTIIGHDHELPVTVFVEGDGTGGCVGNMAALGRSLSAGLEWGTPPENYVKQFSRVKCMVAMNSKDAAGKSCSDIIGKCLKDALDTLNKTKPGLQPTEPINLLCPKCNQKLNHESGCVTCNSCGYSKCN